MLFARIRSSLRVKFSILFIAVLLIVLIMPRGRSLESEITPGMIWMQDDLIADKAFVIEKEPARLKQEIADARENVIPVYRFDESVRTSTIESLGVFHRALTSGLDSQNENERSLGQGLSAEAIGIARGFIQSDERQPGRGTMDSVYSRSTRILSRLYDIGLRVNDATPSKNDSIALRVKNTDNISRLSSFNVIDNKRQLLNDLILPEKWPEEQKKLISEYVLLFVRPNVLYQSAATNEEIALAEKKVIRNYGIVNENEKIIGKHERVTQELILKIESYRKSKGGDLGLLPTLLQASGKFIHIFSLLMLFSIYLFLFRKKIYNDNLKLSIFAILLLWVCFISYIINFLPFSDAVKFLVFIPASSMLITIMFDSRVGFYTTVIFSLICGGLRGNDYPFVVMNVVAGALSVYTVRDIRNRTQIFRSFTYILIGYSITIIAFGFERYARLEDMLLELGVAGTNALISPVLTYGLLVFFERIFHTTTELTLLELANTDHPLLRELAKKAPGSFNHSMQLGLLAENAALSIGANALLARIGAYYHDIGKIFSPRVFVENQSDGKNIHDELDPAESARSLREHIERGKELGRSHRLPEEVIDFIPMHHGTTVMSFFFEKAKRYYGEEAVKESDYRYAGPKPNSKETAIVMLADTCESAVRSIAEPDSEKIDNLVRNLIDRRIEDGQLDESQLTFGDIQQVQNAFLEVLGGQTARRIRYPEQDKLEKK